MYYYVKVYVHILNFVFVCGNSTQVLQISVYPQYDSEVIICGHLIKICVEYVLLSICKFKLIMYYVIFEVLMASLFIAFWNGKVWGTQLHCISSQKTVIFILNIILKIG
jgi:hypothetical protein